MTTVALGTHVRSKPRSDHCQSGSVWRPVGVGDTGERDGDLPGRGGVACLVEMGHR